MSLCTTDFDYELPADRIAQVPAEPRDASRLMVLDRASGRVEHRTFRDLPEYLDAGDVMVANDSRVLPARLHARKDSGGGLEILLLRQLSGPGAAAPAWAAGRGAGPGYWLALIGGRVRVGTGFTLVPPAPVRNPSGSGGPPYGARPFATVRGEVLACSDDGQRLLRLESADPGWLEAFGELPLPPYIRSRDHDAERYQTVYAREPGSAAAPTAGLHVTPALLERLRNKGVAWQTVTLHVGLDTFRPVEAEALSEHKMHAEWARLGADCATALGRARAAGRRVIAVGTTSVRVLESAARASAGPEIEPFEGWTRLFLYPGQPFRLVDALVTNFHLPRSSLLMLAAAFAGRERILRCYDEAIREGYRFYSFGDAMLIL